MITGTDCRKEFSKAKETVKTEEGKALLKTNEVNNKLLLNIRLMLSKVMEALKVPRIVAKVIKKDVAEIGKEANNIDTDNSNVEDK